jgi:hypothetical protein
VNKPDTTAVLGYIGTNGQWSNDEVTSALAAEEAAQAKVCRIPTDDTAWDADLAEALCRRVVANLARRNLPLGLNVAIGAVEVQTTRVGMDQEVLRLERPFRKLVVG